MKESIRYRWANRSSHASSHHLQYIFDEGHVCRSLSNIIQGKDIISRDKDHRLTVSDMATQSVEHFGMSSIVIYTICLVNEWLPIVVIF